MIATVPRPSADSWDTQLRALQTESRHRALTLLDGAEAATRSAIEDAFRRHVAWLLPHGPRVVFTAADRDDIDIVLEAVADTPPRTPA